MTLGLVGTANADAQIFLPTVVNEVSASEPVPTPTEVVPAPPSNVRAGCAVTVRTDVDDDGEMDAARYLAYDVRGKLLVERRDTNGDGHIESTTVRQYDGLGRLVEEITTGNYRMSVRYQYDPPGWLRRITFDVGGDDSVDRVTSLSYRGRLLTGEFRDSDADGSVDWATTFDYDHLGRRQYMNVDTDGDGVTEYQAEYHWSEGRLSRVGEPGQWLRYMYGSGGRLDVSGVSETLDGELLSWTEYEYTRSDLIGSKESYSKPGIWESAVRYLYDDDRTDRVIEEARVHHFYPTQRDRYTYQCPD